MAVWSAATLAVPANISRYLFSISHIIELGALDDADFPILFSQICHNLRNIALANPTFWSTIRFTGGKASYNEVVERLRRSRNAPLDLVATKLDTREDGLKMLELLYPHVARWRTMNLEVWETASADTVMRALVDPAPLLETLTISGFCTAPVNPFGGVTPSLRHLVVRGVPLVWSSPMFLNLESLYVHSSNWTTPETLATCEFKEENVLFWGGTDGFRSFFPARD